MVGGVLDLATRVSHFALLDGCLELLVDVVLHTPEAALNGEVSGEFAAIWSGHADDVQLQWCEVAYCCKCGCLDLHCHVAVWTK